MESAGDRRVHAHLANLELVGDTLIVGDGESPSGLGPNREEPATEA